MTLKSALEALEAIPADDFSDPEQWFSYPAVRRCCPTMHLARIAGIRVTDLFALTTDDDVREDFFGCIKEYWGLEGVDIQRDIIDIYDDCTTSDEGRATVLAHLRSIEERQP